MELSFLGGAGTVTGSKYVLKAEKQSVMVDCGLFQGLKRLRLKNWAPFPPGAATIEAVALTHAHLDHSGYLPRFVKEGFAGAVHSSAGTLELCAVLLPDSGYLQEEQARHASKHGLSKHKPALPLYTEDDARASLKRFSALEHGVEREIAEGIRLRLQPSGHILGASIATLEHRGTRVVFSGDLGRPNDPVMRPPSRVEEADYLVVESTYGNRRHDAADPEEALAGHLNRALLRGGIVVIPAFALGRAQLLLHYLARLKARRAIPDVPVFLNSPMAANASRVYSRHYSEHRLSEAACGAACEVARVVDSADESRALNLLRTPTIILSASGMATGGRVVHHLKAFAPDAKNMILLPGFQAAGTRGASLAAGAEAVKIHGEYVPVRAEVVKMDNLSAHADYAEILDWLKLFKKPPRRTFVTHGEPAAADELRRRIEETLGWKVHLPEPGEQAKLG